jgi:hypothetical protein
MFDQEKTVKKMSKFIEKNLFGNTPFRNTSNLILYIANKELQKKSEK